VTSRQARRTVLCLIVSVLVSVIASSCCGSTGGEARPTPTLEIEIGGRKRLTEEALICLTKADLDELTKTFAAKDEYGFYELLGAGRVFAVQEGTEVLILDWDGSWYYFTGAVKLRVLEGEFMGQAGWAYESCVK
jgi:hypothetical protein